MSKYNLTSLLEIVSSSRVGTIKDSFRDLKVIVDRINDEDLAYVREDYDADEFGKVHYEAKVVYGDEKDQFFTVYDYKLGYDPTTEEYAEEEQNWSLGAPESTRDEGIRKAEELGFNVSRKGRLEEKDDEPKPTDYDDIMPAFSDDAGPRE